MPARRRISDFIGGYEASSRESRGSRTSSRASGGNASRLLDPEEVARVTAEKVVAEYTRSIKGLLESIIERLDALSVEIREINKNINILNQKIDKINVKFKSESGLARRTTRITRHAKLLEEAIDKYKVVMGSEARAKLGLSPHKLREVADEIGAIIIEAGGDFAVTMPEYLEEFEAIMMNTRTSDPEEAAEKMGPYRRLFEALRKAGLVYYSRSCNCWKKLN